MKIALTEEMKQIDEFAVNNTGILSLVLMENAGYAVANEAAVFFGENIVGKKICVFCGKGNNGGDGLVAARHLINHGAIVKVIMLAAKEELSSDTLANYNILTNMSTFILHVVDDKDWDKIAVHVMFSDMIIDAVLGTGFHGSVNGNIAKAINLMNASGKYILSVDIPSGVNGDTGKVGECAVLASQTITFLLPKAGLFLLPGRLYSGKVSIAPIGIPEYVIEAMNIKQILVTRDIVSVLLPVRSIDAHKGDAKIAVIAGSKGMTGAAALCSEAALRAGAGLVKLFTQANVADLLSTKLTEIMVEELCFENQIGISPAFINENLTRFEKFPVIVAGPGLGTLAGTSETIISLLQETNAKLVLDADALDIIADKKELIKNTKEVVVLTPHLGEMARLLNTTVESIKSEGIMNVARNFAVDNRCVLVLKSVPTIIGLPDGQIFINTGGNQGMATAGMGDVLAGTIGALVAQGIDQASAAIAGVYLHSLAGDIVAKDGIIGIAAGDIIAALPKATATL